MENHDDEKKCPSQNDDEHWAESSNFNKQH